MEVVLNMTPNQRWRMRKIDVANAYLFMSNCFTLFAFTSDSCQNFEVSIRVFLKNG